VARAAAEMARVLPRAARATLTRGTVVRERRATFSLAPGQPARPGVETPIAGLLLAGDWIDTGLPGTIESAVVSGHKAAEVAMNDPAQASSPSLNPKPMKSVIVHYQEIRAQGAQPAVLRSTGSWRTCVRATADLDVRQVRPLVGRIELVLGPGARWTTCAIA